MGPAALAVKLGISMELAKEYISQYNETFKVLVSWLNKQRSKALTRRAYTYKDYVYAKKHGKEVKKTLGYSETPSGRKRFYVVPDVPLEIAKFDTFVQIKGEWHSEFLNITLAFNPTDPWDRELKRLAKAGDPIAERIKRYHSRLASIQREGGNAPIQGTNADMTKIAMYEFRKFIRQYQKDHNKGMYVGHIALQVYDELLVVARTDLAQMFGDKLTECMIKAGERFITKVPVEAACVVADTWVH